MMVSHSSRLGGDDMKRQGNFLLVVPLFVSFSIFLMTGMSLPAHGQMFVNSCADGSTVIMPDVCRSPTPGGPVAIPYPNNAQSSIRNKNGSKIVNTAKDKTSECEARFNYFFGFLDENCYMRQDLRSLEER